MRKRPCPCVGAIVKDKRGRYLVLYRMKEPRGLALPAGHIERGETAEQALARELYEETGIRVKTAACLLDGKVIKNVCSRGAKKHRWHVYKIAEYAGKPKRKEKKKHAFVKFMTVAKIREYLFNDGDPDMDPAWSEIFKLLKLRGLH